MRPHLAAWAAAWRIVEPDFQVDSLWGGTRAHWHWYNVRPLEPESDVQARRSMVVWSPDSSWFVDPDIYREPGGGTDADSAPALVHRGVDSLYLVAFSGTMGGWESAFWLDARRFVLIGWAEVDHPSQRKYVTITVYDLDRRSQVAFWTRENTPEQFSRYHSRWLRPNR